MLARRRPTLRPGLNRKVVVAAIAVVTLGLAGCSSDTGATETTASATTTSSTGTASTPAESGLVLEDGWAKAGSGMTGVFGTLKNTTDRPLTVTGGTSPVAGRIETHTMQQKDGAMVMVLAPDGFEIPAGGTHRLAPGEDHIMLIDLKEPLTNGTDVSFTLTTKEGTKAEVTVPVRDFTGADEQYLPGEDGTGGSMDHGTMTDDATMSGSGSMTMTPSQTPEND